MTDLTCNIETPFISVLVPVYNTGQFLKQCLDSIVIQSYKNLQIVLLNDGSTDNSGDICQEYIRLDNRIEYYEQHHSGIAVTRNNLISHAKGRFCIFIDSDDWISPDMIQELYYIMDYHDLDILSSEIILDRNTSDSEFRLYDRKNAIETFITTNEILPSLCTKLIRTDLYKHIRIPEELIYAEDTWATWRLLNNSNRIGVTTQAYYNYRKRKESITHKTFKSEFVLSHQVWKQIHVDCLKQYPFLSGFSKRRILLSDIYLMYWASLSNYDNVNNLRILQKHILKNFHSLFNPFNRIPLKFIVFGIMSIISLKLCKEIIHLTTIVSPQYLTRATMRYDH